MTAGAGIDLAAVEKWLVGAGVGDGPLTDVEELAGGTQNLLLRFRLGDQVLVLRHPPMHKRRESDAVVQREIRVLRVLADTAVPTPRLRAASPDPDVLGSACYVTDFVEGFNPAQGFPELFLARPSWQAEVGLQMVDVLAELARVPVDALLAAGFRSPDGWLERQPARWLAQLGGYGVADLIPAGEELARWLARHVPRSWRPGLIHGDYHLGNVLVAPEEPRLAAVVDWELATVGDPLLDLAHLLVAWPVGNPGSAHAGLAAPGLPDRARMLARYPEDVHHLDWYGVLACFRLGVLLEGSHSRARAGAAPVELGDRLHALAVNLFDQARALVGGEPLVGSTDIG